MISQIDLVTAIGAELQRQGIVSIEQRHLNAIVAAADSIIAELSRESVPAVSGSGLKAWLMSDETGLSSRYMASVLGGLENVPCHDYAHPLDLDDFLRCCGLLAAVPEFRERLGEMANRSEQWRRLVEDWSLIEGLMADGRTEDANRAIMDAVNA